MDGLLEFLPVLRRLTTVVVIWVSLLGAALPAFACSLAATQSDCCGQPGTSSPCKGGTAFALQADSLAAPCCAAGQTSTDVTMDSGRAADERSQHPGTSPDPLLLFTSLMGWSASLAAPADTALSILRPRADAALTYLHTARLRL